MTRQLKVEPAVAEILAQPALNGVYRLSTPIADLTPVLDGRSLTNKQDLLAEIGRALAFPDYYGEKWDALEECLLDLSWRNGSVNLLINHAEAIPESVIATLLEIFSLAAAYWAGAGRGFNLFLRGLEHGDIPLAG